MKETAFMAGLPRARPFLISLKSMREISTMAALIVRRGEIELRICNGRCTSLVSLVLQASSKFPPSVDSIALRLDVNALARELLKFIQELNPNLRHGVLLEDKPLYIYKLINSDEICFRIGLIPKPLRLKPVFEAYLQLDLRDLIFLPVGIILKVECFRMLMESFAPGPVEIHLFDDTVTWRQPSKNLEHSYINSFDCHSVGGEARIPRRLTVDFLKTKALVHASHVSQIAWIRILGSEVLGSWIMVVFLIGQKDFFLHLVRGLIHHEELKVLARSPEHRRRLMACLR